MVTLRFLCKTPFPSSSFLPSQAILSYPELKAASFIHPELIWTEGSKCIWADSLLLMLLRGPMTKMIQSSGGAGF
ncbi:hypothetical protein AAC387_Pa11g1211 [Persea americana]